MIEVSLNIAAEMLSLAKGIPYEEAEAQCLTAWDSGAAKRVFEKMIKAQNGRLNDLMKELPKNQYKVTALSGGVVHTINTIKVGQLVNDYAASDEYEYGIDPLFGIKLEKHLGDPVKQNDTLVTIFYNNSLDKRKLQSLIDELVSCYKIKK